MLLMDKTSLPSFPRLLAVSAPHSYRYVDSRQSHAKQQKNARTLKCRNTLISLVNSSVSWPGFYNYLPCIHSMIHDPSHPCARCHIIPWLRGIAISSSPRLLGPSPMRWVVPAVEKGRIQASTSHEDPVCPPSKRREDINSRLS